jgi:hypothetical protein
MQTQHRFAVMEYRQDTNGIRQEPIRRLDAWTYEDAARQVSGEGLTLIADARIRGIACLVAKVWDGDGFRYVYRYPSQATH